MVHPAAVENRFRKARCPPRRQLVRHDAGAGRHRDAEPGVYLEVVPNKRLVITDAYTEAWMPSAKPFATIDLNFEDLGGKTKYTAIVRHWTKEDKEAHEKMGFHSGWGTATSQLEALIKSQP